MVTGDSFIQFSPSDCLVSSRLMTPTAMLGAIAALPAMAPLPPPEPSELLETIESLDVRKIRFERNRIRLPMGVEGTFGIIRHPGASLAVPITDDGQVVLLRQYRFAVQARLLEFPAGTLEDGEDPLESMKRELGEEAGYSAARWDVLGPMLPCPGYSDEVIHCFLARGLVGGADHRRRPGGAAASVPLCGAGSFAGVPRRNP